MIIRFSFFALCFVFLSACQLETSQEATQQKSTKPAISHQQTISDRVLGKNLMAINREFEGTDLRRLPNGAHYILDERGQGKRIKNGDDVSINFTLSLLNGQVLEEWSGKDVFDFTVGTQQVLLGLDQSIIAFRQGDKGKLILPAKLGYMMMTDVQKELREKVLVYDFDVLKVN